MAKSKMSDMEFGLSALSPAFALSQVASGDAKIGDLGVMGLINRFGGKDDKPDPNSLTGDEQQRLRAMLAAQGQPLPAGMKRGGAVKKMAKGGVTRGDGCATRGKTKGRFI